MTRRGVSARRLLAVVIALELAVLYVVMRGSSWVFDDNYFLVLAGQEGLTWHWLTSVQFEHWDIALHAIVSLQHRLFFLDYRWGLVTLLAVLGAAIYLFERILATLVSNRWVTLAAAAWFGIGILWARPLQWWLAGAQYFPYTLLDLLCLYGFLRWQADRSTRWAITSVGALAAALLFYEKPAYMLFYLLLLRVLLMSADLRPRAVVSGLWRERGLWFAYAAVIGVWGAGYIHSRAYSSHGAVHLGQYVSYFRILWLQTLVPSLAGFTIPAANLSGLQTFVVVACQVALLACVVVSLRLRRSAWRAWTFLAIVIVANGVLVAHSRVSIFGVDIANDPRYLLDYSWLVPIALCAAFAPGGVLRPRATPPDASLILSRAGRALPAVGVLLALYAAVAIASAAHLEKIWGGPQGRVWETNVRRGIAAFERSGRRPMVAEKVTPFQIMAGFVAPYNRLSRVLPMYVGPIQVDGPLDAPLVRVAENGKVHRVLTSQVGGDGSFFGLLASGQAAVVGGRLARRGSEVCVIADGQPASVLRRLAVVPDAARGPYYVLLGYHVWRPTVIAVSVDVGAGIPAAPLEGVALAPGVGRSIAWLGEGSPRGVSLTIPPLTTVCIGRYDVVALRDVS
jgi:hypothetical protein